MKILFVTDKLQGGGSRGGRGRGGGREGGVSSFFTNTSHNNYPATFFEHYPKHLRNQYQSDFELLTVG